MSNYDNVYKMNAYYYKDGFPKDLEYHGIFQSYSKAFQRLLKEAEEVELFVIPDANQRGYVIDIATGISIPVMSYQHYTNHKSVLRQKDRLESSMDPSISFCVFEDGDAFSDTISSPDLIDQYIKEHHGVEHYNMILQYANQNVYLVNPNQDKKMMNAVNEEVIPSVTNSMTFLQLTGNIQSMVTELPIEMQAVYYQRLSKILKQYDESSSTLDGVALDMTLSSFVTELDKLQSEIQSVKEGSSKLQAYTPATFQSFLEYLNVLDKAKDFIHKAFTIIFMASIVIWFLQSFSFTFDFVTDSSQSILAAIGSFVSPIFAPLGFNDWRSSTALMTGITAKESVVSTLTVLTQSSSTAALNQALIGIFTPLSSFTFLVFTVLYMPCVAAFAATKRELRSWPQAILTVMFQTGMAYLVAFVIYQLGQLLL